MVQGFFCADCFVKITTLITGGGGGGGGLKTQVATLGERGGRGRRGRQTIAVNTICLSALTRLKEATPIQPFKGM